jgi:hypothetical protein
MAAVSARVMVACGRTVQFVVVAFQPAFAGGLLEDRRVPVADRHIVKRRAGSGCRDNAALGAEDHLHHLGTRGGCLRTEGGGCRVQDAAGGKVAHSVGIPAALRHIAESGEGGTHRPLRNH